MVTFTDFLDNVLVEALHPELQSLISSTNHWKPKQAAIAQKVKQLTSRGEKTGIEGNMPKGSSRAYLKHEEPHHVLLDGKPASFPIGTKVAIKHSGLDPFHKKDEHDGMNLGALQNHAEGADHWVNSNYRVLTHHDDHTPEKPHFESNKESGIFPPLIDHDHDHHEWTQVGHARDIKPGEFQKLTKHKDYPKGISHKDFVDALVRHHDKNNGKHWHQSESPERKKHLDHIEQHPLVQKFQDYHGNTGNPPHDYQQKKNMGVFEHPDGSHHIVARDHGFNSDVQKAYTDASRRKADKARYGRSLFS